MPAKSKAQRRFFGMCEHNPKASANCPKGMTKEQMHDFAATKEKGLPSHKMPHAPGNPVKKGTTHHASKNLGIPAGPKNKGTTKVPYSSKSVASSIMKRMHRPRGG